MNAAIEDPATPAFARGDLQTTLPGLFDRWRAARKAAGAAFLESLRPNVARTHYQQLGKRDARWDGLVAAGFAAEDKALGSGYEHFKAAVAAGCTDPLVRYFYFLRGQQGRHLAPAVTLPGLRDAAKDLDASNYPAVRKFYGYARFTAFAAEPGARAVIPKAEVTAAFDRGVALLPQFAAAGPDRASLKEAHDLLLMAGRHLFGDRKQAFDRVYPALKAALPGSAVPARFAAQFFLTWAWDARGSGTAGSVTNDGWRLFRERLDAAEKAAVEGWNADPLDPDCCAIMVTVCQGKGAERAEMEQWFRRAMLADPENLLACEAKLTYLLPKWHGSRAEAVAFARECLENGSGASRIPLLMVVAHGELGGRLEDGGPYWRSPEVWRDVRATYEKVLAADVDRTALLNDRAAYLKAAADCRQWQAFLDLSKAYGDEVNLKAFGGKDLYAYFRRKALAELRTK